VAWHGSVTLGRSSADSAEPSRSAPQVGAPGVGGDLLRVPGALTFLPVQFCSIFNELPTSFSVYRVTQEIDFCYGHRLLNYSGRCRSLHGHNGRAVVAMQGAALDDKGMLVDFSEIKRQLSTWIDTHLDHRMILCERDPLLPILQKLEEPVFVIAENPTAENIARLIYARAQQLGFPVLEVALWETPRACAVYRGE